MDKQAVIDAIAQKSIFRAEAIGAILTEAGHFELLEAAERVDFVRRAAIAKGIKIPHEHDCFRELEEALRKAGVYVE